MNRIDPANSPFTAEQAELLNALIPTLRSHQSTWIAGYLAGLQAAGDATSPVSVPAQTTVAVPGPVGSVPSPGPKPPAPVTLLYGSQTGNSQWLAEETGRRLTAAGYPVEISSMARFKVRKLREVAYLLIFVSTQGDGVPPDNAMLFHEELHSRKAPALKDTRYSVLSLGDVSYDDFCIVGQQFDERIAELGATRLVPRADCDLDFQEPAEAWMTAVLAALAESRGANDGGIPAGTIGTAGGDSAIQGAAAAGAPTASPGAVPAATPQYSRFNPYNAEVVENITLNGRGSGKQTQHLELLLEGSGLSFEPGDSIGVYPHNHPELVGELIDTMGWNEEEPVAAGRDGERPLRDALTEHFEITVLTRPLLEAAAQFSRDGLRELVKPENEPRLREYVYGRDVIDLVRDFGLGGVPAPEFVRALRRIPPRLYSIASSYRANPDEVHLAIVAVRYHSAGRDRKGVFSVKCADGLAPGSTVPVYVNSNPNFRLPADPERPVIMIGPGTGVAPFRAFLEERETLGHTGPTWLFYGDRHFRTDFLYQVDWQRWLADGVLSRLDVAFSRDTERKLYVQHRMLERSHDLYEWIHDGAHIYVCGDEKHMAPDVHAALTRIISEEGGMSGDRAEALLLEMQQEGRYARDVY